MTATISVIVPAFRAAHILPRVLAPLMAMKARGAVAEVIVVDDRSPDDTAEVARSLGARVMTTPQNGGPGVARNLAAEHAAGDILWFVDSDVIAWDDGAGKIGRGEDADGERHLHEQDHGCSPSVTNGSWCPGPTAETGMARRTRAGVK